MNPSDKKYSYFQPGEILYLISHGSDQIPSDQEIDLLLDDQKSGGLIGWSNRDENKVNTKLKISRLKERELHFPGTVHLPPPESLKQDITLPPEIKYVSPQPVRRGAFSIIPVQVRISEQFRDHDNSEGHVDSYELTKLISIFDEKRAELEKDLNSLPGSRPLIMVEVVSPNWLSSPSSEYGGGGGPGTRPIPYTGTANNAPFEFYLSKKIEGLCPEKNRRGEGVKVAILDTAPCLHDLATAYEHYHKVDPRNQTERHPLIDNLLRPNGPLHVHPASLDDLLRMRAVYLQDHDYKMTDHGLFVAGIINTIAPAAEIHLYEVLNPNGVGDLESIARGLSKVVEEQYRVYADTKQVQPLVVNCSLILNIPLKGDPDSPNSARIISSDAPFPIVGHRLTDLDQDFLRKISNDSMWVDRAGSVIMWICDLLFFMGSRVIAAAGNDWRAKDSGRPQARYPAAFPSVQGVGALKKDQNPTAIAQNGNYEVASYSDLSDTPGKVGVATLGGEAGEGKGVLGVYLGEFPISDELLQGSILERFRRWLINILGGRLYRPKNTNNWAWWAGTSFATPILTGVIAAILSHPNPPSTTEMAIVQLYSARGIEESRTDYKEDLLNVTQGKP